MGKCLNCGSGSPLISETLSLCLRCIRQHFDKVKGQIEEVHAQARRRFGLPERVPQDPEGVECTLCVNQCRIPEAGRGYCGLRENREGKLIWSAGVPERGLLDAYFDPLPTNCVADWICPAGSGAGYPKFSYAPGPEYGYRNLAVFYRACSFDCLFCQNWHFRQTSVSSKGISARELARKVDDKVACICYFGGDPGPQVLHAIKASEMALQDNPKRILRICWETNGAVNPYWLEQMAQLSLESGGCIKFDLKSWDERLNIALCGVTNQRTLKNFASLAPLARRRPDPPFLIASTLLVPGYVGADEVKKIAEFIASLDRAIPYALLAFHPHFLMSDLPPTSRDHAFEALKAAQQAGLQNVRIGNIHLLSNAY